MTSTLSQQPEKSDTATALMPGRNGLAGRSSFVEALQGELDGLVDFTDAGRALYTSDASNYRQVPLGVVYPRHADDVEKTIQRCTSENIPVLMRGGGTSQNGQCVNNAVVLDCSRFMTSVLNIDIDEQTATVQPGVVCDQLKAEAEKHYMKRIFY